MGRLIRSTNAAVMVGVCPTTLHRWSKDGYFPRKLYIGNTVHYDEDAVVAWLAAEARAVPRSSAGEGHWRAKWPEEFIVQAKKMADAGKSQRQIAEILGMPRRTVRCVLDGSRRDNGVRAVAHATVGQHAKKRAAE